MIYDGNSEEHIQTIGTFEFLSEGASNESLRNKINSVEMSENDGKVCLRELWNRMKLKV